ncbi:VOC family protein [Umezawaea endophytica]|uniref:VOC family protein n=1 Tax=Umezawaea endophytica TaxID=1654476 RepID=A0A9X3A2Z7_9PSEU|nr:VOC family protein [Umezawaea endophytica]MCS7481184.1 VOC family protein [Umezawaea endophytica]
MVTRDTAWPAGTPAWADLGADVDKAKEFYSGLFGWEVEQLEPAEMGYWSAKLGGRKVVGLGVQQDTSQPPSWTTYLATDDVDATAAKVRTAGGQVLVEPSDVLGQGRMAIALDPAGAVFGLWQSGEHTGAQIANEPGAVAWSEHMSHDFEGSKKFYAEVFGFAYDDLSSGDFQYSAASLGDQAVAGIGGAFAEAPSSWVTYFSVADTDAAVARISELGGHVILPPSDSPYGRSALVSDDQGTVFAVIAN